MTHSSSPPSLRFSKLSGSGNDFIALAEPERGLSEREIRALCRRGVSIGADGLFVLSRLSPARAAGRVRMDYWNADGRPADLCLNGTRCAGRLAFHLGWAAADGSVEIETAAGRVMAHPTDDPEVVALELPAPLEAPRAVTIETEAGRFAGYALSVGVPHFVIPHTTPLGSAPVSTAGPSLRAAPEWGSTGSNIDWVRFAGDRLEIRTFERGVEAETLACGTGVLASVAVGLARGELTLPVRALTASGIALAVEAGDPRSGNRLGTWRFAGDARLVAHGELAGAAFADPEPPAWNGERAVE